jgi:hypothetical protein
MKDGMRANKYNSLILPPSSFILHPSSLSFAGHVILQTLQRAPGI